MKSTRLEKWYAFGEGNHCRKSIDKTMEKNHLVWINYHQFEIDMSTML